MSQKARRKSLERKLRQNLRNENGLDPHFFFCFVFLRIRDLWRGRFGSNQPHFVSRPDLDIFPIVVCRILCIPFDNILLGLKLPHPERAKT